MTQAPSLITFLDSLLFDQLNISKDQPWYAAYSGGLDSTVLLHALKNLSVKHKIDLVALHADHQLQPQSEQWLLSCQQQCDELGIPIQTVTLKVDKDSGYGLEASARHARYDWFAQVVEKDAYLFTAHHLDDQCETVLYHIFCGAGVRGLRGVALHSKFSHMHLIRPFLNLQRDELREHAKQWNLKWIDDPSNSDNRFARNHIRNRLLPQLKERWPKIKESIYRTSQCMGEAETILEQVAQQDLMNLDERFEWGDWSLSVPRLKQLERVRQSNLLRYWLRTHGHQQLDYRRLNYMLDEVSQSEGQPRQFSWGDLVLRQYKERLYLVESEGLPRESLNWDLKQPLKLNRHWILSVSERLNEGLNPALLNEGVKIRYRSGGEKCRLPGRKHHTTLKKLFQASELTPWQRYRIPLIYIHDEIAAIPGLTYCEPFLARADEKGIVFEPRLVDASLPEACPAN